MAHCSVDGAADILACALLKVADADLDAYLRALTDLRGLIPCISIAVTHPDEISGRVDRMQGYRRGAGQVEDRVPRPEEAESWSLASELRR